MYSQLCSLLVYIILLVIKYTVLSVNWSQEMYAESYTSSAFALLLSTDIRVMNNSRKSLKNVTISNVLFYVLRSTYCKIFLSSSQLIYTRSYFISCKHWTVIDGEFYDLSCWIFMFTPSIVSSASVPTSQSQLFLRLHLVSHREHSLSRL